MTTPKQAYEWVKTGHWSFSQFVEWVQKREGDAHEEGYGRGHYAGYTLGEEESQCEC